ncbi:hypothetical protein [Antrihabitans spumae]|uniref:Uncharacterized protein n=1 Tax=Antrihabitans spumae TaxID=3373370 RepID=A0ABW7KMR2_9NOCA
MVLEMRSIPNSVPTTEVDSVGRARRNSAVLQGVLHHALQRTQACFVVFGAITRPTQIGEELLTIARRDARNCFTAERFQRISAQ